MPLAEAVLTSSNQKKAAFAETCYVCGAFSLFSSVHGNLREAQCALCGTTKRVSDVARTISAHFGPQSEDPLPLPSILQSLTPLTIFEAQATGPLHDVLSPLPGYVCAEFLDSVSHGKSRGGVRCEDLTCLTFARESFDLVITQDVLEHVPLFEKAFAEIGRILKPQGKHIFTVPVHPAHPTTSRVHVDARGTTVQSSPPVYHGDPLHAEGALVAVDFGNDLADRLRQIGFSTSAYYGGEWYAPEEITWIDTEERYQQYRDKVRERGMLEYFRYNSAVYVSEKIALPFTGERFVPELRGQIAHEHFHRYAMALGFVKGKDVLDIAAGEGYGSALLAGRASLVVGVDISDEAIRHAEAKYGSMSNLRFFKGSCTEIPSPDHAFDVVVSFETLEHIEEQDRFLQEVRRVLRDDGTLIISSPNAGEYKQGGEEKNPYHRKELTPEKFVLLLSRHFGQVELYGQRLSTCSHVWPIREQEQVVFKAFTKGPDGNVHQGPVPVLPEYVIAVCGTGTSEPVPEASVFHDLADDMTDEYRARGVWGQSLERELRQREAEIRRLTAGAGTSVETRDRSALRAKAGELWKSGNREESVAILQGLISGNPDDLDVLLDLASMSIQARDLSTASILLDRVLSAEPSNKRAMELFRALSIRETSPDNSSLSLELMSVGSFRAYTEGAAERRGRVLDREGFEAELQRRGLGFTVPGHCYVCNEDVEFRVQATSHGGGGGEATVNWRESLVCPLCGLNNRTRAAVHLWENLKKPRREERIYLAEQTTPLFRVLSARYRNAVGSEFLGGNHLPGSTDPKGIRHEDLTALSFPSGSFDSILTLDVFEHVPDYRKAFSECCRVLTPGGTLLFSVPFDRGSERTVVRARVREDGTVEHLLPPEYHGDPVNPNQGCLCYQIFGWDVLDDLGSAGFEDPSVLLYWSADFGYLGGEQVLVRATKPHASHIHSTGDASRISMAPIPLWDRDPAFNAAMRQIPFTLVDKQRCFMLYQYAHQSARLPGDVAEVGVYKGGTAKLLATVLTGSSKTLHLFDTFAGMPETDAQRDMHHQGDFADTSLASVRQLLGNDDHVQCYPGFFPATAGPIQDLHFSLVHIDVDIYRSVLDCSEFFYTRMTPGGIMVYDDYGFESCPGAKQAVDEFYADKQERPWYLPTGQCVIVKLESE